MVSPDRGSVRRFLVTGGAGFIGSHVVDALTKRGDAVIVIDNLDTGSLDNLPNALNIIPQKVSDVIGGSISHD